MYWIKRRLQTSYCYSDDWIVESVDCENELSYLTGKVTGKRVTISLKMIGKK